ncbi:MAG: GNA1162 family protein [Candidatus Binataceae bacterium]
MVVGCSTYKSNAETRPFFQHEYRVEAHGRKTILDHLVEVDPGTFKIKIAPDYLKTPPARIAVLPFTDVGNANFTVDKIPLTFRNKKERLNWAWTDAERLRRPLEGYLAEREFVVLNLNGIDAVLRDRGINTPEKLYRVPPEDLGRWFDADAVVYGSVKTYEAYYFGLIAGWQVGVEIRMISTHNGETLVEATGQRYDTSLLVALTPLDIAINSAENLLQLRDINLARAEEETCREIVHRIPISEQLVRRDEQAALDYAEDPAHQTSDTDPGLTRHGN